eukprot:11186194-Lingulodinium_polyedra.AAC.1
MAVDQFPPPSPRGAPRNIRQIHMAANQFPEFWPKQKTPLFPKCPHAFGYGGHETPLFSKFPRSPKIVGHGGHDA